MDGRTVLVAMSYSIIDRDALPFDGSTYEYEGLLYPDTPVSFIWVEMKSGDSIRLHTHPYKEIFIILEGSATYIVGRTTIQAHAGQVINIDADTPHKFANTGNQPLKQIDIHLCDHIITTWLE